MSPRGEAASHCPHPCTAEAFSRPNYMGATRALTEDFWAAWLAASNATALPNLAEYSRMELWRLCRAVHSLLAPDLEVRAPGTLCALCS